MLNILFISEEEGASEYLQRLVEECGGEMKQGDVANFEGFFFRTPFEDDLVGINIEIAEFKPEFNIFLEYLEFVEVLATDLEGPFHLEDSETPCPSLPLEDLSIDTKHTKSLNVVEASDASSNTLALCKTFKITREDPTCSSGIRELLKNNIHNFMKFDLASNAVTTSDLEAKDPEVSSSISLSTP